jgi:lactoylglutathione lyase
MTKYLHTMIRVTDPEATICVFELIGLNVVRRMENERGATRSFFWRLTRI